MIDQSHIEIASVVGVQPRGHWYEGPCPFCGGKDRFYINANKNAWGCRQCTPGYSDPLAFVAKREGYDLNHAGEMKLALAQLNIEPEALPQRTTTPKPPERAATDMSTEYACYMPSWQAGARAFVDDSYADYSAREYVTGRGIELELIRKHHIGFNRCAYSDKWGETEVYLKRGVVIPTYHHNQFWRIRFRLMNVTDGKKYKQIAGGGNSLFYARPLVAGGVVVLVEGEFDALALASALIRAQEKTGNTKLERIAPVATCGTTQSRVMRHVVALSTQKHVLVAFDAEDAGETASRWWLERLKNSRRLVPTEHDVNDMVTSGRDMVAWLRGAFS